MKTLFQGNLLQHFKSQYIKLKEYNVYIALRQGSVETWRFLLHRFVKNAILFNYGRAH